MSKGNKLSFVINLFFVINLNESYFQVASDFSRTTENTYVRLSKPATDTTSTRGRSTSSY